MIPVNSRARRAKKALSGEGATGDGVVGGFCCAGWLSGKYVLVKALTSLIGGSFRAAFTD